MKKEDNCYIEDILKSNKTKAIEQKTDDGENNNDDINKLKTENNEKEKKLGDNIIQMDEKNNYNLHEVTDKNPFSKALKGGAIACGAGVGGIYGSLAACMLFNSVYLGSAITGELYLAGYAFFGGLASFGIGLIVAAPSLLGYGVYKYLRWNKDRNRQEFFKNFGEVKMSPEKEVYLKAINKIDKYFNNFISNDDNETKWRIINIQNYISSIIDIYINIENKKFNSSLELMKSENNQYKIEELIKKMNYEVTILAKNISKINFELMRIITSSVSTDIKTIFDEGIPYFREFIKIFGPLKIDEKKEKTIDESMTKLIQEMKWILEKKMQIAFNNFDSNIYVKSFGAYLIQKFGDKKNYDLDMDQNTFISNCNDFLIQPIADRSIYYGVLSLFCKFTTIVQDIAIKKKDINYNKNKEKLENMNQGSANNEVYKSSIILGNTQKNEEEEDIAKSKTALNIKDKSQIPNNNENINITFIIEKKKIIIIQAQSGMSIYSLINRFNQKVGYDNNYIKKYLIDDKIILDPSSNETLQEKGLTDKTKIMIYNE